MTARADASELGAPGRIHAQTASSHLAKLEAGGLIEPEKTGASPRYTSHRPDVASVLEGWRASPSAPAYPRPYGPKEPALRRARICYDHLAGDPRRADASTACESRSWCGRASRRSNSPAKGSVSWRRRCRSTPTCWPIRAARCARPASTGASAGTTLAGTLGAAVMNRFTELNWPHAIPCPQPRRQFHPHRRKNDSRRCSGAPPKREWRKCTKQT